VTKLLEETKNFSPIVTFNGRGFDVPFVYLRSALLNVPISRKDWLGYRFQTEPHCDLAEQFTFYGVSGREGAARRFNLDFYCKAFGIDSPKSHGVTGMDVNTLLAEGKHREIAEYCLRDVRGDGGALPRVARSLGGHQVICGFAIDDCSFGRGSSLIEQGEGIGFDAHQGCPNRPQCVSLSIWLPLPPAWLIPFRTVGTLIS
jgi:hypothetical protein